MTVERWPRRAGAPERGRPCCLLPRAGGGARADDARRGRCFVQSDPSHVIKDGRLATVRYFRRASRPNERGESSRRRCGRSFRVRRRPSYTRATASSGASFVLWAAAPTFSSAPPSTAFPSRLVLPLTSWHPALVVKSPPPHTLELRRPIDLTPRPMNAHHRPPLAALELALRRPESSTSRSQHAASSAAVSPGASSCEASGFFV